MQTKLELEQYCSVMHCKGLSSSCKQLAKRSAGKSEEAFSKTASLWGNID